MGIELDECSFAGKARQSHEAKTVETGLGNLQGKNATISIEKKRGFRNSPD